MIDTGDHDIDHAANCDGRYDLPLAGTFAAIAIVAMLLAGCSTVQTTAIPADDSRPSAGARENTNPLGADKVNASYGGISGL